MMSQGLAHICSRVAVKAAPRSLPLAAGRAAAAYSTSRHEPMAPRRGHTPQYCTAEEAVALIAKSDCNMYVQGIAATPTILTTALTKHAKQNNLRNINMYHIHTEGPCPYVEEDCEGIFRAKSLFLGANVRKATQEGRADYVPIFLGETPLLFRNGHVPLRAAIVQVSPPDKHGYCSLGTSVDCTRAALQMAELVIGQVNSHVPRTHGDGIIHFSNFDAVVRHDHPLYCTKPKPGSEIDNAIGKIIADNLVEDEATIQMGIGNIPNAVLANLTNHKDLGIHSEMFSDGVLDLVEKGALTGRKKTESTGKLVSTFLLGSQRLYDFVNDNPMVDMVDVSYTNNPLIISRQWKMTAINSCIEIDLTGQVVSDSIGQRMYSGVGGQVDFLRGAGMAKKGKAILAIPSRTNKGISRIAACIKEGAGVVTTRAHVHYIVTEYGYCNLFGKSLEERAQLLIGIAHPEDRQTLTDAAVKRGILRKTFGGAMGGQTDLKASASPAERLALANAKASGPKLAIEEV